MRTLVVALLAIVTAGAAAGGVVTRALLDAKNATEVSAVRAQEAQRAADRARLDAAGALELVASCESQARADLDAAHARIRALEASLRSIAATNPCRARLPRPIADAPRPLWCEDRTSWWATPLPTAGAGCYSLAERDGGWLDYGQ